METYDVALLDLDGVVYLGSDAAPGAAAALEAARDQGMRCAFVTNNASRTPAAIAAQLCALGVPAAEDDIVTSAQAAATLLADRLPEGAAVLVVGGEGLRVAVRERGLRIVSGASDGPAAVVQGFSADLTYDDLTEAALAIRAGAVWVATNADPTLPTPRGLLPGNGALVAAVATATGASPTFAGKPERPLHEEAMRRSRADRPLVVGDRLDTDIEGAVRGGSESLLVLTGVTDAAALLAAPAGSRPSYVSWDLSGLLQAHPAPYAVEGGAGCGAWRATRDGGRLRLERADAGPGGGGPADDAPDDLDSLRALCAAAWAGGGPTEGVLGPTEVLARFGLD